MSTLRSLALLAVVTALLSGCNDQPLQQIPLYQVQERDFVIEVPAFGELQAAEAKSIIAPGRRPMSLTWLQAENSQVKKGDVIARFDAEQLRKDSRKEELSILSLQEDLTQRQALQAQQVNEVKSDQALVGHEFTFADQFAIDDVRVYSKLEIIDTLQNRDFLGAKDNFLQWKEGSIGEQHDSANAAISIRRQGHSAKFEQHQQALSRLQVFAPHDGLLVYQKDRSGEKPSVGQTLFPGQEFATIPDLSNMQAKVFVLANEAIGLAAEQRVEFTLDAYPQQQFSGKVLAVSAFPRSIQRGNPITYYEVTVSLDQQQAEIMQPGRKLNARILVQGAESRLLVPLQAIHHRQGRSFVYVQQGNGFHEQQITTAKKNQYFVEVTQGLNIGEHIALSQPLQDASQ